MNTEQRLGPKFVAYKTMGVGHLLSADYSYVSPTPAVEGEGDARRPHPTTGGFLLAAGGDGNDGAPSVWYSDELAEVTDHFYSPTRPAASLDMQHVVVGEAQEASTAVKTTKPKKEKSKKKK